MHEDTQYWLDTDNKIVKVNTAWNTFAVNNDAPELVHESVLGHSLLNFIAGDDTRMLITALIDSVRVRGEPIRRPYRCDSPDCRRYMEMYILPENAGHVRLVHHVVSIETLVHPVKFITIFNDEARIVRCSICNQIRVGYDWMESDAAYRYNYLSQGEVKVVYRVCPNCQSMVQEMTAYHTAVQGSKK